MSHLYIFTAGGKTARENLNRSIQNAVPIEIFRPHVSLEQRELLERIELEHGGIFEWGAKPGEVNTPNWERLAIGDTVLVGFDGAYRYFAHVVGKFHNRAAAEALWGQQEDGKYYEYMYFLSHPRPINVRYEVVEHLLNERYFGFTRISDAKVLEIERQFGSVEAFVQWLLVEHHPQAADTSLPQTVSPGSTVTVFTEHASPPTPPINHIDGEKEIRELTQEAEERGDFDINDQRDTRQQTIRAIVQRRGQPKFRKALMEAYDRRCAITGYTCAESLEAAHIKAYRGEHTNDVRNGLLLRADIHTLFDLGRLAVNADDYTVVLDLSLLHSEYKYLHGRRIALPARTSLHPSKEALRAHREACGF